MRIELVFLGKTKEKYLATGIEDFTKRLSRYTRLEIKTIKDRHQQKNLTESQIKEKEGGDLLA
ncbi:MAG: 23S rRNA (pseudouridine(1915)-N(3))-methyltransferase RlmH, partial [Proteobacteria bacterium]|nr:23S rRNA (pseudouridine(1915)-N(3))-methyltransferase RlmH [Pseudomonadota bacterium]